MTARQIGGCVSLLLVSVQIARLDLTPLHLDDTRDGAPIDARTPGQERCVHACVTR